MKNLINNRDGKRKLKPDYNPDKYVTISTNDILQYTRTKPRIIVSFLQSRGTPNVNGIYKLINLMDNHLPSPWQLNTTKHSSLSPTWYSSPLHCIEHYGIMLQVNNTLKYHIQKKKPCVLQIHQKLHYAFI